MLQNFEIIAGIYEEFLLGYKIVKSVEDNKLSLCQSFATHEHTGIVRCVSVGGKYVATGSTDDRVVIYDMLERKETYILNHHESTITCLEFNREATHLMIGCANGEISIVRVGTWQVEKLWPKAHKEKPVLSIRIHNSSKLALSLGADCTLRTWNLIKGRQAFAINLNSKSACAKSLTDLQWEPKSADKFLLFGGFHVELWSINTGGIVHSWQFTKKLASVCWIDNDEFLVGFDDGSVKLKCCSDTDKEVAFTIDESRIKALKKITKRYFVAATSSGKIILLLSKNNKLISKADVNCGCRITCLDFINMANSTKDVKKCDVNDKDEIVKKRSKNSSKSNKKLKS